MRLRRLLGGRLSLRRRARRGHSRHGRGWTAAAGEWPAVVTVRPSRSTTARLFGVDESALLFNRLLAYRGQAPEAMRAWLRDTYLVAREAGALHFPTLLSAGADPPRSTRTATAGCARSHRRSPPAR